MINPRVIVSVEPINELTRGTISEVTVFCKYPDRVKERILKAIHDLKEEIRQEESCYQFVEFINRKENQ